jgi:uncharacterized cupredoxin-like copper-binding protein
LSISFWLALVLLTLAVTTGWGSRSGNTVNVTLTEYKITASQTTFTTGVKYHFVVTNQGQGSHELMLMPPVNGDMGMGSNMGDLDKMALARVDESHLPPGANQSFDYTFTDPAATGKLEFACHVGDHYEMGMRLPITVTKA